MGKRIHEKESDMSMESSSHHGGVLGILRIIKHHHWRHVKKRLTHRRHVGGRNAARNTDASGMDNMQEQNDHNTKFVKEKLVQSTSPAKFSVKARIRALTEEITGKKGKHKRSSTYPAKSQLNRANSVNRLEHSDIEPLAELPLNGESSEMFPETSENKHTADTLGVLSPVSHEISASDNEMCIDCGTRFSSDFSENNHIHKHQKQLSENHALLLGKSTNIDVPEENLMHANILTADASPVLLKDFLDALDIIKTNKDLLLKFLQDPGSPVAYRSHNQQASKGKTRLAKSVSFPAPGSSSGSKESDPAQVINKTVDYKFNTKGDRQLKIESQTQSECMSGNSECSHQSSIPSESSSEVDRILNQNQALVEKSRNFSANSSRVQNQMAMKRFKDLKQKMKHVIRESKNEKHRITMDAILHKIPHGNKLSKELKKIVDQSKDTVEGKDNATSIYNNRLSTNSFSKRQQFPMRTSSLKESVGRYSQLYETCFNRDVKYRKSEKLRLRTEETGSILRTPNSFQRFLSMPNIKSDVSQSEEPFSSQSSKRKLREKITSVTDEQESCELGDSHNQYLLTHVDNTNQESIAEADHKEYVLRSYAESGSGMNNDADAKESIRIDSFRNLKGRRSAACNETVTQTRRESISKVEETKSASFSDSISLDDTVDFEKLSITSDSELKPMLVDGFDNISEQEDAKAEYTEVVRSVEEFENAGVPSKHLNYKIPFPEVTARNKAEFDYVRDVLEISGFTGHGSLGIWYSDDQPVDPLVYEELEGCLLLDPDCFGSHNEGGRRNYLLLFDVVNEVLLEIFGRSYSYYPKPLSSLSHLHPMPAGNNVLREVWTLISWYLSSKSDDYLSLDYYVSRDLAKDDDWMNLQFDSECVGFELDDLIFDDLLEEIICT